MINKNKDKNKNKVKTFETKKFIRLNWFSVIIILLFLLLTLRIFWLQFIQGKSLKEEASKQQIVDKTISPQRGTIYDSTGKSLAISIGVDTVSIEPSKVKYSDGKAVDFEIL